ncbi:MAG: hypothetical protein HQK60_19120, partial [Deltaproteobacteria bacterium]|nr:hypothetical protein [Deltaproteobacteria bacterium]
MTWVNQGGYYSNPELSLIVSRAAQPSQRIRQFVDVKEAKGKGVGDTFYWNKVSNVDDADNGAALVETDPVPCISYNTERGTILIDEYGKGINRTGKFEALSMFNIPAEHKEQLRLMMGKSLDTLAYNQFNATKWRYVATGAATAGNISTSGSTTVTCASQLNGFHMKAMIDY